jgi:O-antigen biosynthesis protein
VEADLNPHMPIIMKARNWISTTHEIYEQLKRLGGKGTVQSIIWRLQTAAGKQLILLQDRFGWYTFADWIKENEPEFVPPGKDTGLTFSFLLPVTPESIHYLKETLNSLSAQSSLNWEVWLIYPNSCALEIAAALSGYSEKQAQIFQVELDPGSNLAASILNALDRTNGDWTGLIECGDTLPYETLSIYLEYILNHPQAEIIYSDEDVLAKDGQSRRTPFFKPDWSPELLLSVNYLAHAIFRREVICAAAQGSPDFEDATYRCAQNSAGIVHVPRILYHRREHSGNSSAGRPPQAATIKTHLERQGLDEVSIHAPQRGIIHATWSFQKRLVSIIILTRDRVEDLKRCVQSLLERTRYPDFEILLVENNSQQPETLAYYETLRRLPQVRIIEWQGAFNYSAANNYAARQARGDLLLFLNNDVEAIDSDWLEEMARWASRPDIGVVGAKLIYPNGAIQHAGIILGMEGHGSHIFGGIRESHSGPYGSVGWYRNYLAVTGACMMMNKEVFLKIGGFDESYSLVFSDIEICLRTNQLGYRVVYDPFARLVHYEGRTRSTYIPASDIQRGYEHFAEIIARGDRYYNPNLSLAVRVPTLKRRTEPLPIQRLKDIVKYT